MKSGIYKMWKLTRALVFIPLVLLLASCDQKPAQQIQLPEFAREKSTAKQEYIFSIHPLHNPKRLHEIFGPVVDYLSNNIDGATFRLEASRNYAAYDEKLYSGKFHFSLPNPFQTVNALKHGYRVFGKMGDDANFRGIILVRKDSGIKTVADLKGKAISYPAPTALAATMMPQYYLHTHGIDVMKDVTTKYVGSQESSIMNVFLKNTAAGATWPPPWRALAKEKPELEQELQVIWQTEPLPNNGLVVREDIDKELEQKVANLLFNLHTHAEGKAWLEKMELSRFEPATESTYEPVRKFIEKFSAEVRPVE